MYGPDNPPQVTFHYPEGRRTKLDNELIEQILTAIPQVLIQSQVAAMCYIPRQTLNEWLNRGQRESLNNQETIFAQLADRYHAVKAAVLREHLMWLRLCPKNYQALTWILEKCFREDFGAESEELRELREIFKQLLPLLGKGGLLNGKKVDTENAHEEGSATQGTGSANGEENTREEAREGNPL